MLINVHRVGGIGGFLSRSIRSPFWKLHLSVGGEQAQRHSKSPFATSRSRHIYKSIKTAIYDYIHTSNDNNRSMRRDVYRTGRSKYQIARSLAPLFYTTWSFNLAQENKAKVN